jgi:hypothetical protein
VFPKVTVPPEREVTVAVLVMFVVFAFTLPRYTLDVIIPPVHTPWLPSLVNKAPAVFELTLGTMEEPLFFELPTNLDIYLPLSLS